MTTVGQHLINQGRVEGRVEGIGKVLLQQLHQCFGDLPQRLVEQIHNAGEAELLRWTGRVLDASSPEEVLAGC